ncbi:MAG: two-component sensor histidine kinase, partial [Flavobacteriaceae bacterium]
MSKRLYVFLVVLMSLALLGIIIVQGYWIKQSVEDKEERFSNIVSDILHDVADKIEKRETRNYFDRYINLKDSVGLFEEAQLRSIFFIDRNLDSDELRLYKHGILEENYTLPSTFFDNDNGDSS